MTFKLVRKVRSVNSHFEQMPNGKRRKVTIVRTDTQLVEGGLTWKQAKDKARANPLLEIVPEQHSTLESDQKGETS